MAVPQLQLVNDLAGLEAGVRAALEEQDLLPFSLDEDEQRKLMLHFTTEVKRAITARSGFESKCETWIRNYEQLPKVEQKMWPWPKCPLSRDTEILTRDGWCRIDHVQVGTQVLTRKDSDGSMEWAPVEATPSFFAPYLYEFHSKSIRQQVTKEHQMVVVTNDGHTHRYPAWRAWITSGLRVPLTGAWTGAHVDTLFGLDAGDVLELIGWFVAEGWAFKSKTLGIAQSKAANPEKCAHLEALFDRLHIKWRMTRSEEQYLLSYKSLPRELGDLLNKLSTGSHAKHLPSFVFDLTPPLIRRLLNGLIWGDGNTRLRDHQNLTQEIYHTASPRLADEVQVLAVLSGMRASVSPQKTSGGVIRGHKLPASLVYRVSILHKKFAKLNRAKRGVIPYNDLAFCVTVKNHAILVRRDGIASWTGNSNIVVPITSTGVDAIFASVMSTIFAGDRFYNISPTQSEIWRQPAEELSSFLEWARTNDFNLYDVATDGILEALKLGTSIIFAGYQYFTAKQRVMTRSGRTVIQERPIKDGVALSCIRLMDFIIPANALDVQSAPWCARRITGLTWGDLVEWSYRGWLENIEAIKSFYARKEDVIRQMTDRAIGLDQYMLEQTYDLFELWGRYDIDGDGREEEIKLRFHLESSTYQFGMHNDNVRNVRPFFRLRFFPREHAFYGIGIGEMVDQIQEEISTIHNQRRDNNTIANMKCFKIKTSYKTGRGAADHLFPGKRFYVNDMDDIDVFSMGDKYDSTERDEALAQHYAERRTGVTDYILGRESPQVGSRATATSTTALLHQGNKRFELSIREMRETFRKLGIFIISLYQTNNPKGIRWGKFDPEKQLRLQAILALPPEDVYDNLDVDLNTTSASLNRELEKQNTSGLLQILMMYYEKLLQSAMMVVPMMQQAPPIAELLLRAGDGAATMMRRIVTLTDFKDAEAIVPSLREVLMPQGPQAPGGAGGPAGGLGGVGGTPLQSLLAPMAAAMQGGGGEPPGEGERGSAA